MQRKFLDALRHHLEGVAGNWPRVFAANSVAQHAAALLNQLEGGSEKHHAQVVAELELETTRHLRFVLHVHEELGEALYKTKVVDFEQLVVAGAACAEAQVEASDGAYLSEHLSHILKYVCVLISVAAHDRLVETGKRSLQAVAVEQQPLLDKPDAGFDRSRRMQTQVLMQ